MDYNNCNGWNEYAGTYEGSYYAGDAAFARTESAGENCRSTAAAARLIRPGHSAEQAGPAIYTGRDIWQDLMPEQLVIVRLRQGRLPGQQAEHRLRLELPLLLQ